MKGIGIGLGITAGFFGGGGITDPSQVAGLIYELRSDRHITQSGTVSVWGDNSAAGNPDAAQATSAAQPVYTSSDLNFNNLPSLSFGSGQFLLTNTWSIPSVSTIFAVGSTTTTIGYAWDCGAAQNAGLQYNGFGGFALYDGANLNANVSLSTPSVACGVFNGTSSRIYVSAKTAQNTGTIGAGGVSNILYVGASGQSGGSFSLIGSLAHFLIYDHALVQADVEKVLAFLGTRYGISIGS